VSEVEIKALEDEIEEVEDDGASDRKIAPLKARLAHWHSQTEALETMLCNAANKQSAARAT
jgi:ribosome-interacting GTPase 1